MLEASPEERDGATSAPMLEARLGAKLTQAQLYSIGFARNFFKDPRCFFESIRLSFAARPGRVGIRLRGTRIAALINSTSLANASLRFFSWVR